MKRQGAPNTKNLNHISKEISRNLEHAISSFSVKHCVGKLVKGDDISNESDDEHSLELLDPNETADKVFGPAIPPERRLVLTQTFQKMASVMREKKDVKTSILMKWRLVRLNERFKLIGKQNKALLMINKMFDKRHNAFFKICEAAKVKTKVSEAIENTISANGSSRKKDLDFVTESMVITTTAFDNGDSSSDTRDQQRLGLSSEIENLKQKVRTLELELSLKQSENRNLESDWKKKIEEVKQDQTRQLKAQQESEDRLKKDLHALRAKFDETAKSYQDLSGKHNAEIQGLQRTLDEERNSWANQRTQLLETKTEEIQKIKTQYEDMIEKMTQQANDRIKQLRDQFEKDTKATQSKVENLLSKSAQGDGIRGLVEQQVHMEFESKLRQMEQYSSGLENDNSTLKNRVRSLESENLTMRELVESFKKSRSPTNAQFSKLGGSSSTMTQSPVRSKIVLTSGEGATLEVGDIAQAAKASIHNPFKLPPEYYGTVITNVRKGRILMHALRDYQRLMKQKGFSSILKAGVYSRKAKGEAGLRVRGRILATLREKYKDVGVRRAFLRWSIFINRTFLRDCITKVALNSKITHQSALWRFRKLSQKVVKFRLPEAVRNVKYTSGLHLLDLVVRSHQYINKVETMNVLRPPVVGKVYRLLINLINRRSMQEEGSKLRAMHQLVMNHREKKMRLASIITAQVGKQKEAYRTLVEANRAFNLAKRLREADIDFRGSLGILEKAASKNVAQVFDLGKLKTREQRLTEASLMAGAARKSLLAGGLHKLVGNNQHLKAEERRRRLINRDTLNLFAEKQNSRVRQALDKLRGHTAGEIFNQELGRVHTLLKSEAQKAVCHSMLDKLVFASRAKQSEVLEHVRIYASLGALHEKHQEELNEAQIKLKRKTFDNAMQRIIGNSEHMKSVAIRRLLLNKSQREAEEQRLRYEEETRRATREKITRKFLDRLKLAQDSKQKEILFVLNHCNKNYEHDITMKRIQEESEQRLRRTVLRTNFERLRLAQESKERDVLQRFKDVMAELEKLEAKRNLGRKILRLLIQRFEDRTKSREAQALSDLLKWNMSCKSAKEQQLLRIEKEVALKRKALSKLLDKLRMAQKSKQQECMNNFHTATRRYLSSEALSMSKREADKRLMKLLLGRVVDRIKAATEAKARELLLAMNAWAKEAAREQELRDMQENFFQVLRQKGVGRFADRAKNLRSRQMKSALDILRAHNVQRAAAEKLGKKILEKLIQQVNHSHESRLRRGLNGLIANKNQLSHEEAMRRMQEETFRAMNKKMLTHMLDKLTKAQEAKEREAFRVMNNYVKWWLLEGAALAAREEALQRIKASLGGRIMNALLTASQTKERIYFNKLRNHARQLVMADETNKIMSEAEAAAYKKKLQECLNRLKICQDGKQMEAFRGLVTSWKELSHANEKEKLMSEAERKMRLKRMAGLLSLLRLGQINKQRIAVKNLKNHNKEREAEELLNSQEAQLQRLLRARILKGILGRLVASHEAKTRQCCKMLRDSTLFARLSDELYKIKRRELMNQLIRSCLTKSLDAFDRLRNNRIIRSEAERVQSLMDKLAVEKGRNAMNFLLEKIRQGQVAKQTAVLAQTAEMARVLAAQEVHQRAMEQAQAKLNRKIVESVLQKIWANLDLMKSGAVRKLLLNKNQLQRAEEQQKAEEAAQKAYLDKILRKNFDRLKLAQDAKLKEALFIATQSNKNYAHDVEMRRIKTETEARLRRSTLRTNFERLRLAQESKERDSIQRFKDRVKQAALLESDEMMSRMNNWAARNSALHKCFDRLKNAMRGKTSEAFVQMAHRLKTILLEEAAEKERQLAKRNLATEILKRLIQNFEDATRSAEARALAELLRMNMEAKSSEEQARLRMEKEEALRMKALTRFLEKLRKAQQDKTRQALGTFVNACRQFVAQQALQISQEEAEKRLKKYVMGKLLEKLRKAQEAKQLEALTHSHEWAKQAALEEELARVKQNYAIEMRESLGERCLNALASACQSKQRICLNALRTMSRALVATEKEQILKTEAEMAIYKKKLQEFLTRLKHAQESKNLEAFRGLISNEKALRHLRETRTLQSESELRLREKKLTGLLSLLKLAQTNKQRICLKNLKNHNKIMETQEQLESTEERLRIQLRDAKLKSLFGRLKKACDAKCDEVLQGLATANTASRLEEEAAKQKKLKLLNALMKACLTKNLDSFGRLQRNRIAIEDMLRIQSLEEQLQREIHLRLVNSLLERLRNAQAAKAQAALAALGEHNRVASTRLTHLTEMEHAHRRLSRKTLDALLARLAGTCEALQAAALKKLMLHEGALDKLEKVANAEEDARRAVFRKTANKGFDRLKLAQVGKLRESLFILRNANRNFAHDSILKRIQDENEERLRMTVLKSNFERLKLAQEAKQREAFQSGRDFFKTQALLEAEEARRFQEVEAARRQVFGRALERLRAACRGKCAEALSDLDEGLKKVLAERAIARKILQSMLNRLASSNEAKARQALSDLLNNKAAICSEEEQERLRLEGIQALKKKTFAAMLDRLKTACDGKQRESLNSTLHYTTHSMFNDQREREITEATEVLNFTKRTAEEELEAAKRDAEERYERKLLEALFERLRASCAAKQLQALQQAAAENVKASHEEEVRRLEEEAAQALRRKKALAFLARLITAQNAKQVQALHRLQGYNNWATLEGAALAAREELAAKIARGLTDRMLQRLANALQLKERAMFNQLKDFSRDLVTSEAMENQRALHNETLTKKKALDFLARLKAAQDAKALEALRGLLTATRSIIQAEETERLITEAGIVLNKKKLIGFLTILKLAQEAKQRIATRGLRNHAKELIEAQKLSEAEELRRKELAERALRNLLGRLKTASGDKLAQAMHALTSTAQMGKFQDAQSQAKLREMLNSLVKACLTKSLDSFGKLQTNALHRIAFQKLEQLETTMAIDKQRSLLNRVLDRLKTAQAGKALECLTALKTHKDQLNGLDNEQTRELRHHLAMLSEIGGNTARRNTAALYARLVGYAQEQRRLENLAKNLISNLIKAQLAKMRIAAYNLRQNNLYSWSNEQLNTTKLEMELERDMLLKRKMFKTLYKAHGSKAAFCLKALKHHKNAEVEREARMKNLLDGLAARGSKNNRANREKAYIKLVAYGRKNKEYEDKYQSKLKFLLAKWQSNALLSEADALDKLRAHNRDALALERIAQAEEERSVAARTSRLAALLNRLQAAQVAKEKESLVTLNQNKADMEHEANRVQRALKYLLGKIQSGSYYKVLESLDVMKKTNKECERIEEDYRKKMNFLLNRLSSAHGSKMLNAFSRFRALLGMGDSDEVKRAKAAEELCKRLKAASLAKGLQALLRLNGHNSEERALEEAKLAREQAQQQAAAALAKRLFDRLAFAQQAKTGQGINMIRSQNLEAVRSTEYETMVRGNLLNKLMSAQLSKLLDALRRLQANERAASAEDALKSKSLRALMARVPAGQSSKLREAWLALKNQKERTAELEKQQRSQIVRCLNRLINAQQAKQLEAFQTASKTNKMIENEELTRVHALEKQRQIFNSSLGNLLARLNGGSTAKMLEALRTLREHRQQLEQEAKERASQVLTSFARLQQAQDAKRLQAFEKLRTSASLAEKQRQISDKTLAILLARLNGGSTAKMLEAFRTLGKHNEQQAQDAAKKAAARRTLINRIVGAHAGKSAESLHRLATNSAELTPRITPEERMRALINRIQNGNRGKLHEALQNLSAWNQLKKGLATSLISKLIFSQMTKMGRGLDALRANKADAELTDLKNAQLRNLLAGKLSSAARGKETAVLQTLRAVASAAEAKDAADAQRKKGLFGDLVEKHNSKLAQALQALRQHNAEMDKEELRKRLLKNRLLSQIASASNTKLLDGFRRLQQSTVEDQKTELKKRIMGLRLANALANGSRAKQAQALAQVRLHNDDITKAERARQAQVEQSTKFIFEKIRAAREADTRSAYERLLNNYLQSKLQEEKKRTALASIVHSHEIRMTRVLYNMRINKIESLYQQEKVAQKLAKLDAWVARNKLKDAMEHFKQLIQKRPDRVIKVVDIISSMIRLREQQAFGAMQLVYNMSKFEQRQKALMALDDLVTRMNKKRRDEGFYELKTRYHNDNPWFKRSIDKLSVQVSNCVQVAFWKIKVKPDFGNAALPVETSIKLKNFVTLIEKKRQKMLQRAMTRIDVGRSIMNLNESMLLNNSYIDQSRRATTIGYPTIQESSVLLSIPNRRSTDLSMSRRSNF